MNLGVPSMSLLAASGGDTIKVFNVAVASSGDPCVLSYSPSPGSLVNSVKWNHTNLVVASAGEDRKISLWRKNGQSMGTIPLAGMDSGDNIEESILAINFSNKGPRYICSGGTGQVMRIWDLQRKRCIKWLKGHTSTITGAMYNCKDEHLASVSLSGDLILHNLASGARATELKDPNQQLLRVLDYSRMSRHLLVTSGDDGSIHLWDTTGRTPKVSWSKQHSAPTAGISFSPSSDKTMVSIGLDKKLYTYDTGSRRPSSCISYEAPFSSLAYRDDGLVLACGTGVGSVVFYDIRGKPQPVTVLRAYNSSEAVTSLCWQRSKPTVVNENCSPDMALLGGSADDSIVMPDPLPSVASSSVSLSTAISGSRNFGRSGFNTEVPSLSATMGGHLPIQVEETPHRTHLRPGGSLARLNPRRPGYNLRDDMDVFSPIVEVQPITPSFDKLWDNHDGLKRENLPIDKKSSSLFPSSSRQFPFPDDSANDHPISDWNSSSTSRQDDNRPTFAPPGGISPTPSANVEDSVTPPEAWGGERLFDRCTRQTFIPSHFGMSTSGNLTSVPMLSSLQELPASPSQSQTNLSSQFISSLGNKDRFSNLDNLVGFSEQSSSSTLSVSLGTRGFSAFTNSEPPGSLTLPRRSYAERIGATSAFSDGALVSVGTPKVKKTGVETREEIGSSLLSRSDLSNVPEPVIPSMNGGTSLLHKTLPSEPQGSSFTLQLFQRTLEETVDSFQESVHKDTRNLHLEILRQFHMQEMEFSAAMRSVHETLAEMMKEIKTLRKENQELRQLL